MKNQDELQTAIAAKTDEIERYVAQRLGYSDPDKLPNDRKKSLKDEVEQLIDEHEEALVEGNSVKEWVAKEARLNSHELGRLLLERHELCERLLDLRDSDLD